MYDVIAMGETMVAFEAQTWGPLREAEDFKKWVGGAADNFIITVARLGFRPGPSIIHTTITIALFWLKPNKLGFWAGRDRPLNYMIGLLKRPEKTAFKMMKPWPVNWPVDFT